MKKKITVYGISLVLFLSWVFPIYGVIYNRVYPSYESALGVAYGFFFGCIIHSILFILWIGIRRWRLQKAEFVILLTSFCISIVLAVLSNTGALSKVSTNIIQENVFAYLG